MPEVPNLPLDVRGLILEDDFRDIREMIFSSVSPAAVLLSVWMRSYSYTNVISEERIS